MKERGNMSKAKIKRDKLIYAVDDAIDTKEIARADEVEEVHSKFTDTVIKIYYFRAKARLNGDYAVVHNTCTGKVLRIYNCVKVCVRGEYIDWTLTKMSDNSTWYFNSKNFRKRWFANLVENRNWHNKMKNQHSN